MTTDAHPLDAEIVAYLTRRLEAGNHYVKARHLVDELGEDCRILGKRLAALEEQGLIERWRDTTNPKKYRIRADAIDAEPDSGVTA